MVHSDKLIVGDCICVTETNKKHDAESLSLYSKPSALEHKQQNTLTPNHHIVSHGQRTKPLVHRTSSSAISQSKQYSIPPSYDWFPISDDKDSLSGSEVFLSAAAPGLSEERQSGHHLLQRQLSVHFVVSRAHVHAVSDTLLLAHHCKDKQRQTRRTAGVSAHAFTRECG